MSNIVNLAELHTLVPVIWPVNPSPKAKESPLFLVKCPAGFPSPAADYVESGLDLNDYLVKHRAATFIFDVCGDSMCGVGMQQKGPNVSVATAELCWALGLEGSCTYVALLAAIEKMIEAAFMLRVSTLQPLTSRGQQDLAEIQTLEANLPLPPQVAGLF